MSGGPSSPRAINCCAGTGRAISTPAASARARAATPAATSCESARTYDSTTHTFGRVELVPPAGYGVMRVQQELGASKSVIGVTLTTVHRGVDSLLAPQYTKHAYAGGADSVRRWDRGAYEQRG